MMTEDEGKIHSPMQSSLSIITDNKLKFSDVLCRLPDPDLPPGYAPSPSILKAQARRLLDSPDPKAQKAPRNLCLPFLETRSRSSS